MVSRSGLWFGHAGKSQNVYFASVRVRTARPSQPGQVILDWVGAGEAGAARGQDAGALKKKAFKMH